MSRIGKLPVNLPSGVAVSVSELIRTSKFPQMGVFLQLNVLQINLATVRCTASIVP